MPLTDAIRRDYEEIGKIPKRRGTGKCAETEHGDVQK
jgi:hypothetical protein